MWYSLSDAKYAKPITAIDIDSRVIAYGDGFFTTMAVVAGQINWLSYHLDRIDESAQALQLNLTNAHLDAASLDASNLDASNLESPNHTIRAYFNSQLANFAKIGEPYFDLLDSPMYIELQWYYASAYDNANVKNLSIQHAKTAFHLTQNWFGQDGSGIVAHMVQGQPIKNTSYHGILVELARCDNYHCDLVVRKPTVTPKTAKKSG